MARMENDAHLSTMMVQSTALRRGIDLSGRLPLSQMEDAPDRCSADAEDANVNAAAAGANAANVSAAASAVPGAADLVPVSYDPGLTCEIRLDMED